MCRVNVSTRMRDDHIYINNCWLVYAILAIRNPFSVIFFNMDVCTLASKKIYKYKTVNDPNRGFITRYRFNEYIYI